MTRPSLLVPGVAMEPKEASQFFITLTHVQCNFIGLTALS